MQEGVHLCFELTEDPPIHALSIDSHAAQFQLT